MIQGVNAVALVAAALLGLVEVLYVQLMSGAASRSGPAPLFLIFLTAGVVASMGGGILPQKPIRIALLALTCPTMLVLGAITSGLGLGMMLAGLLAGAALLLEISQGTRITT